jgi:hypothetical protein
VKCVIDGQTDIETGQVCDPCRRREHRNLADIARLHAQLTAAPDMLPDLKRAEVLESDDQQRWSTPPRPQHRPKEERDNIPQSAPLFHRDPVAELMPAGLVNGEPNGPRVSGSREASLPLSVDALDLSLRGRVISLTNVYEGQVGEQIGHLPAASVLDAWVQNWRQLRNRGERQPVPTVPVLVAWLTAHIDWACDYHTGIRGYHFEILDLITALRGVCGELPPKPELCAGVPCPECDYMNVLYRSIDGSGDVECGNLDCRRVLTAEQYQDWVAINAAYAQQAA